MSKPIFREKQEKISVCPLSSAEFAMREVMVNNEIPSEFMKFEVSFL